MEVDLIPKAGYSLELIHAEGLKRSFSLQNVKVLWNLQKGIQECKALIEREKPSILIGTGGYVTAPLMLAGIEKKIPTMIHESNALPGKTTIWLSSKVDTVAVGFEAALKKLPKAKHAVYTGNPTKMKGNQNKQELRKKLGFGNEPVVLIFGGSQGAKRLNEIMVELIRENTLPDCRLIYATGPKNYESVLKQIPQVPQNVKVEKYIYNMEEMMVASDLLICRSGALTTSEIGIAGTPAILIPFPYAAENHQYFNAKTLEDAGAAVVIEENDLTKEELLEQIKNLLSNKEKLEKMGMLAKKTGKQGVLENIAKEIDMLT